MKFRKNSKHKTSTGQTVKFVREVGGITEYQDAGGRIVPMHSHLFEAWVQKGAKK
jgi:hypothetical protein